MAWRIARLATTFEICVLTRLLNRASAAIYAVQLLLLLDYVGLEVQLLNSLTHLFSQVFVESLLIVVLEFVTLGLQVPNLRATQLHAATDGQALVIQIVLATIILQ